MNFRKASHSMTNGNCVEVGEYRKASYSFANGNCVEVGEYRKAARSVNNGACVEVGHGHTVIAVRDTTDRDGVSIAFSNSAWGKFLDSLKSGA